MGETAAGHFAVLRAKATERVLAGLDPAERRELVGLLNRATARRGVTVDG